MMKEYYRECKNTKEINSFLKKINLGDFEFDSGYFESILFERDGEFDFDGWVNEKETKGVSIQVTKGLEVFVTKYTKKDLEERDKEWGLN